MRILFILLALLASCSTKRNDGMGSLYKGVGCVESPDKFEGC